MDFRFESSRNIILASCQALFSQSTLSSFNLFFLSPPSPFGFLAVDFGVCNSFELVPRFLNARFYLKRPSITIPHFLDCDLNFKTLEGKCI
jgi:hypothetical protein